MFLLVFQHVANFRFLTLSTLYAYFYTHYCFPGRELLEHIKLFEEKQFSGIKGDKEAKLMPMNESGGSALLKIVC